MDKNYKKISVTLEDYVIDIANEKAKLLFNGNLNYYINWLICSNNLKETRKELKRIEEMKGKIKPTMLEGSEKVAMYNSICDYCKKEILPYEEICKAEGYKNYIHKKCCNISKK